MSTNRLDAVDTFDQFGHDHWKALGTKLGGVGVVKAVLRGTHQLSIEPAPHLSGLTVVKLSGGEMLDPNSFFCNREYINSTIYFRTQILHRLSSFGNRFGSTESKITADVCTISYADLRQEISDAEVGESLPNDYVFKEVETFVFYLASFLYLQQNGGKGFLLNNGCDNIFYVTGECLVAVRIKSSCSGEGGFQQWNCTAYRPDGDRPLLDIGTRVFSAVAP